MTVFKDKRLVPILALTAAAAWGCAYPLIKLGIKAFGINPLDTGGKALFAGIRFFAAGLIVLAAAKAGKRSLKIKSAKNFGWVLLFALINTALHYFCFYIGVSNSPGARSSVLNSLGTFLLVFLSCAFFKEEHLSVKKVLGCLIGFGGLVLMYAGKGLSGKFTLSGDGMIILNALCSAFGGILTKTVCKKLDVLTATGLSLSLGGIMLISGGVIMGGKITKVTPYGIFILFLLIMISTVAFSIYNRLIQYHSVGQVAIYNSTIPIFGVIMSSLIVGEAFLPKYVISALLVAAGVFIINFNKTKKIAGSKG